MPKYSQYGIKMGVFAGFIIEPLKSANKTTLNIRHGEERKISSIFYLPPRNNECIHRV